MKASTSRAFTFLVFFLLLLLLFTFLFLYARIARNAPVPLFLLLRRRRNAPPSLHPAWRSASTFTSVPFFLLFWGNAATAVTTSTTRPLGSALAVSISITFFFFYPSWRTAPVPIPAWGATSSFLLNIRIFPTGRTIPSR